MMNEALRNSLSQAGQPVTEKLLRQILRQEIPEYVRSLAAPKAGRARKPRTA
jgi:hypothetical protein